MPIIDSTHAPGRLARAIAADFAASPAEARRLSELLEVRRVAVAEGLRPNNRGIAAILGSAERAGVVTVRWDRGSPRRPSPEATLTAAGLELVETLCATS